MKQLRSLLLIYFFTVISIEVKQFISFKDIADPNFTIHTLLQEDETQEFVLEIPKGYCYLIDNIITQEGNLLKDPLILTHNPLRVPLPATLEPTIKFYPERVAVITCRYNQSYYHWLLQIVSRIIVLHYSGVRYDRIYIAAQSNKWRINLIKIILAYYQIDYEKVIIAPPVPNKAIQAETLIVPSIPLAFNNYAVGKNVALQRKPQCPQWLLQELRTIFLHAQPDAHPEESYERIYISRSKGSKRKVTNEVELIEELEKRDFKVVYPEELSTFEQARLFNKARVIVGPHGAGFANIVFSNPGYIIIELEHFLTNVSQRQFFTELASFTGGKHFQYYVDRVPRKQRNSDMMVPLDKFLPYLDNILNHCEG